MIIQGEKPVAAKKKKAKKKAKRRKLHENLCFKCKGGGKLFCCDYKDCTKVFCGDCLGDKQKIIG